MAILKKTLVAALIAMQFATGAVLLNVATAGDAYAFGMGRIKREPVPGESRGDRKDKEQKDKEQKDKEQKDKEQKNKQK